MTSAEAGRLGGLATKGKLVVTCPFTGRQCHTAAFTALGQQGAEKSKDIPREVRQAWGRKGRAIAGRGRPKDASKVTRQEGAVGAQLATIKN